VSSPSAYERAVLAFRADPTLCTLVDKNYLEPDLLAAASRYAQSDELSTICEILWPCVRPGQYILDLGAGRGLTSLALAAKGFRVISVDCDASEVVGISALARVRPLVSAPVAPMLGNVLALPFRSASFDAVFCRSLLHHLPSLSQGVLEMFRVLRPGGVLVACNEHVLSIFSNGSRFLAAHPAVRHGVDERAYPAWTYLYRLRRAGFRRIGFFRYPLDYAGFLSSTRRNRFRARLVATPLLGRGIARFLYLIHLLVRAFLFVPEQDLAAISLVARKPLSCQPIKSS
jgi:SAM-dependent methyltransferase